MNKIRK